MTTQSMVKLKISDSKKRKSQRLLEESRAERESSRPNMVSHRGETGAEQSTRGRQRKWGSERPRDGRRGLKRKTTGNLELKLQGHK